MSTHFDAAGGSHGSPAKQSPFRIPTSRGFIPLSEDASLSTRGQRLPALIRERTSTTRRRRSSLDGNFAPGGAGNNDLVEASADLEAGSNDIARTVSRDAGGSNLARVISREAGSSNLGRTISRDAESGLWDSNPRGAWREGRETRSGMTSGWGNGEVNDRRLSAGAQVLLTPQMRSMRLIGNSNPRYRWEQYWKDKEELKIMSKPLRKYYERNNYLIQQYMYIDRLLDSSLPHNLIQEYQHNELYSAAASGRDPHIPPTVDEEHSGNANGNGHVDAQKDNGNSTKRIKRTPKAIYRHQDDENTPLLQQDAGPVADDEHDGSVKPVLPDFEPEEETSSSHPIVTFAIYLNLAANTALLAMKIVVTVLTSSVSVLASLVDAALDFLSTAIVWTTTRLISHSDQYAYPVGRRRLEPVGVLVFSVIMITSFFQVALQGLNKLTSGDREIVELSIPAIAIMAGTVVIKFACWLWCRLINNSSVQTLAQDAMTDVVFNIFPIIFPLIGFYARIWWLDPLGGIILSFYVIINWSYTSASHIRNLTGAAATADERNVLLYLTMRFAKSIRQIQGLQAYHAGDSLNVEVDIVLDEGMSLRDSHDLGESLQYVLESVPGVERAFVHQDYTGWNLPSHMQQDDDD